MASSVMLQNHSHHHQHVVNFNRNNNKNLLVSGNNGVNFSGGSSNASSQFNCRQQQQSAEGSNNGEALLSRQQSHPPKPNGGEDVSKKQPEGVGSTPNGSNNGGSTNNNGANKGVITRAVLAQKYLVQFEDPSDSVVAAAAAGAKNSISGNGNTPSPPPQAPHVGPTKVPLKCMKLATKEIMQCKITLRDDRGVSILAAHQRLGECGDLVNPISELIVHPKYFYLISPATYGNLHSYIYSKASLKEIEAKGLFKQMVSIVNFCHSRGVVLRDLKLGRFVFTDKERTTIKLESLEDVVILPSPDSEDDSLDDRHGCPNYVSPEKTECVVRNGAVKYSGKSSDIWALGISLYAMLAGRYPFNENDCSRLLRKIRTGCYSPIDGISPFAKSLVRCLLTKNPQDRPSCLEILNHPWFRTEYLPATPTAASQSQQPTTRHSPVAIRRDLAVDSIEMQMECSRAKRMKMSCDDDQVVPGS